MWLCINFLMKSIYLNIVSPEKEITCSSPLVNNSVKIGTDVSVHRVGDTMTITCDVGFQLDGAQQITCGPNGQWQPKLPQCLRSPDKTSKYDCYYLANQVFFSQLANCSLPFIWKIYRVYLGKKLSKPILFTVCWSRCINEMHLLGSKMKQI